MSTMSSLTLSVPTDADHGYVFVQEASGPCFGCLFPYAVDSRTMRVLRLLPLPISCKQLER